jgi:hypothetical protein
MSLILICCRKELAFDVNTAIVVHTDKSTYNSNEKIILKISNNSDSSFYYIICNGYQEPIGKVEKYENNNWKEVNKIDCIGYGTGPGGKFLKRKEIIDSLNSSNYNSGTFRFSYEFYKLDYKIQYATTIYYSNSFQIK